MTLSADFSSRSEAASAVQRLRFPESLALTSANQKAQWVPIASLVAPSLVGAMAQLWRWFGESQAQVKRRHAGAPFRVYQISISILPLVRVFAQSSTSFISTNQAVKVEKDCHATSTRVHRM